MVTDCSEDLLQLKKKILHNFQCIDNIKEVDDEIIQIENRHKVSTHDEMIARDRLNFGLVEVVYEWARNKVSSL